MSFTDYLPWPLNQAGTVISAGKEAIANSDAVAALRRQAREWAAKVVELHNTPVPAQYAQKKQDLLSRAKTIKNTIEKIFGTMPEFANMNLGAVPLIVVGVTAVAAAAALITKWTVDYSSLKANLSHYTKMVSDGVDPTTAAKLTAQTASIAQSNSITGNLAKIVPFVVIGGFLIAFKDKIFK